jgi:2-polyprenyl-6-methoxyphenol hydroxylase-like FAD-dependent oxidoreductase
MSLAQPSGAVPADAELTTTDVNVIGGGPAGLAIAIELGSRGIRTVLVEQQPEIPDGHPRAAQLQVRTMEFFRRWGLTDRLRAERMLPPGFRPTASFATSLTGHNIATAPFFATTGGPPGVISAEEGGWAPQFQFTRWMEERVRSLPSVEMLRGWRFTGLSQNDSGVTAELEQVDGTGRRTVTAAFLVAADGGQGSVRSSVGIDYSGTPNLASWLYIPFRAPGLADALAVDRSVLYYLFTPAGTMVARPINAERWDIQLAGFDPSTDIAAMDLEAVVRTAIGTPEVEFTIGEPAVIALHDLIADRYRSGRVFLTGDAAHLIVHYGGHNGNTGIADAVNLGWKLAAAIRGWGAAGLLDSYELERRPAALRTRDTAMASMQQSGQAMVEATRAGVPTGDGPADREARDALREKLIAHADATWQATGVSLDQRYDDSPVVVPDGTRAPEWDPRVLSEMVSPGHRAPHVHERPTGSIHDAFGPEFTLLRIDAADDGADPLITAAREHGVPLTVLDRSGQRYADAYGAPLTLIRPDGHIGWRGAECPSDPGLIIDLLRGADVPAKRASGERTPGILSGGV